jgi:hypothetical protein
MIKMNGVDGFVVGSAASLFLPAVISLYTQPFFVSLVLLLAALFSTLYHESDETTYATADEITALIAFLLVFVMLTLLAVKYGIFSRRVVIPFVFGAVAVGFYLFGNDQEGDGLTTRAEDINHSIWHIGTTLAATFIVIQRDIPWNKITARYVDFKKGQF